MGSNMRGLIVHLLAFGAGGACSSAVAAALQCSIIGADGGAYVFDRRQALVDGVSEPLLKSEWPEQLTGVFPPLGEPPDDGQFVVTKYLGGGPNLRVVLEVQ